MQAWYGRRPALPPWRTASVTSRRIFAVLSGQWADRRLRALLGKDLYGIRGRL